MAVSLVGTLIGFAITAASLRTAWSGLRVQDYGAVILLIPAAMGAIMVMTFID